ncbi:MAG TPA: tRNA (adenosine(37)-N6)-threonylcarbamoyltransferase complex dimerization subunit type 1 TsaB [Verrucomicrobiae bacterium]|jgi:tRNA threonylcarbamoyl adenosine modification protein YeaZ|nr:tRNA (adenosine(37)-N6)-threonylcarbamoyltransferase complex dimerization subunit type 1 TsaB [Verrucomicrobiae bacterium]
MKILALEFSSPQRSVAVTQKDEFHESVSSSNAPLTMIEEALRAAKLEREQIECLVVGIGPGSYTGIRAGISIAQGWQLARAVKTLRISSAECIAAQAQSDGATGSVHVVIDAQREELYLASYELTRDSLREVEPLKIVTLAEARQRAEDGGVLIGPEVTRWFASGKTVFPRAATLGCLALDRTDFIPGEKLEPIYLRETNFVKAPPPRTVF